MKYAINGFLILTVALLVFVLFLVTEPEIEREPLSPENWPVTVEEVVGDLLPRLYRHERLAVMFMKKERTFTMHFDLGLLIRNRYGLWRGNEKLLLSACGFPCHPDDASGKILEAVWQELHK